MDLEKLVRRLQYIYGKNEDLMTYIRDYEAMPLTLSVRDEPMRRISEVFTNNGFITLNACEGHGKQLPNILFSCQSQKKLNLLAEIVIGPHNFNWEIFVNASKQIFGKTFRASLNPDWPCYYLAPVNTKELKEINPSEDREGLLEDLDIMGIWVKKYFEEEKAYEEEIGHLSTVADKMELLDFSKMQIPGRDYSHISILPKVEYFEPYHEGVLDYFKSRGDIEELKDGFIVATEEPVLEWETNSLETIDYKTREELGGGTFEKIPLAEGCTLNILVLNVGLAYFFPTNKNRYICCWNNMNKND